MIITIKTATTAAAATRDAFNIKALKALCATAINTPVTENFDFDKKVGVVRSAFVKKGELFVDCELDNDTLEAITAKAKIYLVPAFKRCDFECIGFGLTTNPVDTTLPHIEI